jgi:HEPN domain-containing protein
MSNRERANRWLEIVSEDLSVAEVLYKTGHWLYVGFMCHQVIEKTLKAYWCVCRDDDPPYIHDHERIAKGCGIYTKMSEEQKDFLEGIKRMNIEARYQEVKDAVARSLNSKNTARILETTKQLHAWILQKLQEKSTTL